MRVAIAHDYLTQRGGAERLVLAMVEALGRPPVVTSLYAPALTYPEFRDVDVRTGPLQKLPRLHADPRLALALLPAAWNRTHAPDADVVVASTTGWAHGVQVADRTALVAYCHNPARWLYQTEDYLPSRWQRAALRPARGYLARWDRRAAARVDTYIANSTAVAGRIERVYGIEAEVLHPAVSLDVTAEQEPVPGLQPGFWLTVGRGRGYKNVRAVVDGVGQVSGEQLAVVGSPPPGEADHPHVRWLGVVSDAQLRWLYANARALVAVSYEDFGLTPVEANAFGTPVVVLRAGGYLDSTVEGVSGIFVEEPTAGSVADGLRRLPELDREAVLAHADRFSQRSFAERLRGIVARAVETRAAALSA